MELILAAIIVIGIIAFIAYPLFTPTRAETEETPGALDGLAAQRDSAYDAIHDLDFDFQMGKLSPADYTALRDKYRARAAIALQEIDALGGDGAGTDVEAQVAQLRAAKRTTADDTIEREVARLRAAKSASSDLRCGNCGTPYHAGDAFCAKCGNKL
ncbi:MAG: zinc ribbon domain-containing protein [Chloroflexota bacterium]|nr:zinc ribbon domain-containing protein [Chloroflexota bacterium]